MSTEYITFVSNGVPVVSIYVIAIHIYDCEVLRNVVPQVQSMRSLRRKTNSEDCVCMNTQAQTPLTVGNDVGIRACSSFVCL